jgi:hypothetical protein
MWALQGDQAVPKTTEMEPIIPRVSMLVGVHDRINRGMPPFDGRSISPASSPPKTSNSVLTPSKSRYGSVPYEKNAIMKSIVRPTSAVSLAPSKKQSSSKPSLSKQGNFRSKSAGDKRNTSSSARPGTFTHMPTPRSIYATENKIYNAPNSEDDRTGRYSDRNKSRSLFEIENVQQYEQNGPLTVETPDLVVPLNESSAHDVFNQ